MNPHMRCSAVLILATAEGLTTRDSTGSNQRKPDFFSAHKGTDYLLYQILHWGRGKKKKTIFVSKKMLIIITQHGGMAHFQVAYDGASNSIKYEITTFSPV